MAPLDVVGDLRRPRVNPGLSVVRVLTGRDLELLRIGTSQLQLAFALFAFLVSLGYALSHKQISFGLDKVHRGTTPQYASTGRRRLGRLSDAGRRGRRHRRSRAQPFQSGPGLRDPVEGRGQPAAGAAVARRGLPGARPSRLPGRAPTRSRAIPSRATRSRAIPSRATRSRAIRSRVIRSRAIRRRRSGRASGRLRPHRPPADSDASRLPATPDYRGLTRWVQRIVVGARVRKPLR